MLPFRATKKIARTLDRPTTGYAHASGGLRPGDSGILQARFDLQIRARAGVYRMTAELSASATAAEVSVLTTPGSMKLWFSNSFPIRVVPV